MGEGLDLAIKQVKALDFLIDVGGNGGILEFREKIKEGAWMRPATVSHLKVLFRLQEAEAEEVIDKFLGGITIL